MKVYILSDQRSNVHKRSRYYAWPNAAIWGTASARGELQGWVWRLLRLYFYSLQRSVTWHPFSLLYFVIWLRLLTLILLILNSRMYFPPHGYCGWHQVSEDIDSFGHSSGKSLFSSYCVAYTFPRPGAAANRKTPMILQSSDSIEMGGGAATGCC